MKRNYIMFDSQKLKLSPIIRWILLIVISYFSLAMIAIIEEALSSTIHISVAVIELASFYIRGFLVLTLIHDLAPNFGQFISIAWSMLAALIYAGIDSSSGDKMYIATVIFTVALVLFNIFVYQKPKKQ